MRQPEYVVISRFAVIAEHGEMLEPTDEDHFSLVHPLGATGRVARPVLRVSRWGR